MTVGIAGLESAVADRYQVERELGQGGMATVYLAHDLRHDRKVALKVLKPELAAVLGADRFVVEIKTTAALQHAHILPLFDSGEAGGFLYYVMPFVQGETLRTRLDRETQLGVSEAVRIATDVADALHYAHTQGVIHRDIKPENILLANGRPMVADFGIALAVSAAAGGRMTETGLSLGTPHYMSPEQATAEKEITGRSDIYSLGSVLYEMLAGDPPHYAVARDGSFVVYLARVGDGTQLWYRSLRGTDARPIPGTEGAGGTPRLSPDGTRLVFQVAGEMKLATLAGGGVTTIGRVQDPHGGEWLADGRLFFADHDGRLLRWIEPGAGSARELPITYCVNPQLIRDDRVLCGGGADNFAFVVSMDRPQDKIALRQAKRTPGTGSAVLVGSHFRIIDGRYLVYMSVDGTLMGTRIEDLDSLTVGRSIPLVPMVRRSSYSGVGQFDLTDDGTLTYVPGINADIGRLVRLTRDGRTVPLPVAAAAYLRFTPSPDGRQLATVAQGLQHQELDVFDLESGTRETLDTAFYIGAPVWSPGGGALAYRKSEDPSEETLLLRRLDSPGRPIPLLSHRPPLNVQVSSWLAPNVLVVGSLLAQGRPMIVDPTRTPATVDSIGLKAFFVSISPDRRWIAYQPPGVTGVHLQPWPALDRRYLVDAEGTEPRWVSSSDLVYLSQYRAAGVIAASIYRTRIDPNARSPVGAKELIVRDPRFADTPGWSLAPAPNGEVIYLQSPSENLGFYLRVIPNWVDQMKRAVDAVNQ